MAKALWRKVAPRVVAGEAAGGAEGDGHRPRAVLEEGVEGAGDGAAAGHLAGEALADHQVVDVGEKFRGFPPRQVPPSRTVTGPAPRGRGGRRPARPRPAGRRGAGPGRRRAVPAAARRQPAAGRCRDARRWSPRRAVDGDKGELAGRPASTVSQRQSTPAASSPPRMRRPWWSSPKRPAKASAEAEPAQGDQRRGHRAAALDQNLSQLELLVDWGKSPTLPSRSREH